MKRRQITNNVDVLPYFQARERISTLLYILCGLPFLVSQTKWMNGLKKFQNLAPVGIFDF